MKMRTLSRIGFALAIAVILIVTVKVASDQGGSVVCEGRYNYEAETSSSFVSSSGYIVEADEGMEFLILGIIIANDGDRIIHTNPLLTVWTASCGGVDYGYSEESYIHPGYRLEDVQKGATATSALVFEVPEGLGASDFDIHAELKVVGGKAVFVRDSSLRASRSPVRGTV